MGQQLVWEPVVASETSEKNGTVARPFGAAVIGLGVGQSHAAAYARLPESCLVALCDANPERLRPAAERYACRPYTRVADLLVDPDVEVVSIATPHPTHSALAIDAMRAGKHVVVEKPMTLSLPDADAMIAVSCETGRTLGVMHQRRLWPAAQRAHAAIRDGKLGRVIRGECVISWFRTEAYYRHDAWRGRWDTEGGGILVNQGVHALDLFQWLVGEPVAELWARWANLTHPYLEVDDNVVAAMTFAGGALGTFQASSSTRLSETRITLHGSNGASIAVLEQPEGAVGHTPLWTILGEEHVAAESMAEHLARGEYIYTMRPQSTGHYWPNGYQYRQPAEPPYHARYLRSYLRNLAAGLPAPVPGEEARKSVELIAAIYESSRTGASVSLPLRARVES